MSFAINIQNVKLKVSIYKSFCNLTFNCILIKDIKMIMIKK